VQVTRQGSEPAVQHRSRRAGFKQAKQQAKRQEEVAHEDATTEVKRRFSGQMQQPK